MADEKGRSRPELPHKTYAEKWLNYVTVPPKPNDSGWKTAGKLAYTIFSPIVVGPVALAGHLADVVTEGDHYKEVGRAASELNRPVRMGPIWTYRGNPTLREEKRHLQPPPLVEQKFVLPPVVVTHHGAKMASSALRQSQAALLEEQKKFLEQQRQRLKQFGIGMRERQEQEQQIWKRRRLKLQGQQEQLQRERMQKKKKRKEEETLKRQKEQRESVQKRLREREERMRREDRSRPLKFLPFAGRPIRGGSPIPGIGPVQRQPTTLPPTLGGFGGGSQGPGPGLHGLHKLTGTVSEGSGFTVIGSFGSPAYQRSILRGLSSPGKGSPAKK